MAPPREKRRKDPDRKKILNHNGRLIDVDGPQFRTLLQNGYKINDAGTQLVENSSFIGDRFPTRPRGRPPGKAEPIPDSQKVVNPETGRKIKKDGILFKKITKQYAYNEERNEIDMYVRDPIQPNLCYILVDGPDIKNYLDLGFIYEKKENILSVPITKSERAFKNAMSEYDIKIVNKVDPLIQMKLANDSINRLLVSN